MKLVLTDHWLTVPLDHGEPGGETIRVYAREIERVRPAGFDETPEWFTGEHVFPRMFAAGTAVDELAAIEWPRLYDPSVLAANEVPAAAAIYTEDRYVERRFSEETVAAVPNLQGWVTSEYDHNGLRTDGERILGRLIDLVRGRA